MRAGSALSLSAIPHLRTRRVEPQVAEFQAAPEKAFRVFDFLVGVALKKLQFKASPGKVNAALRAQLTTPRA